MLIPTEKLERFSESARTRLMYAPYFYHGTVKAYEASIRTHGLLSHSGFKSWAVSLDRVIYFTTDRTEAIWFARNGFYPPTVCELLLVRIPADFVLEHIDRLEEDSLVHNGQCFLLEDVDIPPEILTFEEEVEQCT